MRPTFKWSVSILAALLLTACAQYENRRGVEVNWQQSITENLVRGESTRQDTLALLGPPSQVISLDDGTVLYYLFERSRGTGLILLVYNDFKVDTNYDRAVFFFDGDNQLTDYATHINPTNEG